MFSSKKDLEAAIVPGVIALLVVGFLWLSNISFALPETWLTTGQRLLTVLNQALTFTLTVNAALLIVLSFLLGIGRPPPLTLNKPFILILPTSLLPHIFLFINHNLPTVLPNPLPQAEKATWSWYNKDDGRNQSSTTP